jgi:cbb3-type cytochrome oxidase maturation protein
MNVLIWLVPMALGLGLTGLFAFLWTLRNNQYDDLEGAALRILDDDDLIQRSQPLPEQDRQPQLPRSGPDGQAVESSHLAANACR